MPCYYFDLRDYAGIRRDTDVGSCPAHLTTRIEVANEHGAPVLPVRFADVVEVQSLSRE